jgi:hypothetical protein
MNTKQISTFNQYLTNNDEIMFMKIESYFYLTCGNLLIQLAVIWIIVVRNLKGSFCKCQNVAPYRNAYYYKKSLQGYG